MNYCELVKKIAEDPTVKIAVHLGHDITVRELYEMKAHIAKCQDCNDVLDELDKKYPPKQEFYKGEPN